MLLLCQKQNDTRKKKRRKRKRNSPQKHRRTKSIERRQRNPNPGRRNWQTHSERINGATAGPECWRMDMQQGWLWMISRQMCVINKHTQKKKRVSLHLELCCLLHVLVKNRLAPICAPVHVSVPVWIETMARISWTLPDLLNCLVVKSGLSEAGSIRAFSRSCCFWQRKCKMQCVYEQQ